MSESQKTKMVGFRLGLVEWEELEATAKLAGKTVTEIVRECVREKMSGQTFMDLARQELRNSQREFLSTIHDKMLESASKIQIKVGN